MILYKYACIHSWNWTIIEAKVLSVFLREVDDRRTDGSLLDVSDVSLLKLSRGRHFVETPTFPDSTRVPRSCHLNRSAQQVPEHEIRLALCRTVGKPPEKHSETSGKQRKVSESATCLSLFYSWSIVQFLSPFRHL